MLYQSHNSFESEYKKVRKKIKTLDDGFSKLKKLLSIQFDTVSPVDIISPAKLHHIKEIGSLSVWKVEMEVPKSGLRQSQLPRLWFSVHGDTITFLTIGSHTQNYDNNEKDRIAEDRLSEL